MKASYNKNKEQVHNEKAVIFLKISLTTFDRMFSLQIQNASILTDNQRIPKLPKSYIKIW